MSTDSLILGVIMKVSELIEEFVPCEICGNNDLENFYFYVLMNESSQAYVKCCECEEIYYSTRARKNLVKAHTLLVQSWQKKSG